MTFLQKAREGLHKLMVGRRGADELSLALLITGLALSVLTSITRIGVFYLIGLVAYGFSIYRMFSRQIEKRYGMIYVDMDDKGNGTLKRSKKKSYDWMKRIIETNGAALDE